MRYLTERLMQTVFFLIGFPFLRLFSPRWLPEITSTKCAQISRFRPSLLAPCAHNTNWDTEPLSEGSVTPGNPRWVNNTIPRPVRSSDRARSLLKEFG
jgi:hypothetical protein